MAQLNLNSYWKFDFLNHSHSLGCDGTTTFSSENRDGRLPTLAIGQRREISLEYWLWEAWTCSWDLPSSWFMGCDGSKYLFRNQVYNASARLFSITRSSPTAPYFLQVWTWVKCIYISPDDCFSRGMKLRVAIKCFWTSPTPDVHLLSIYRYIYIRGLNLKSVKQCSIHKVERVYVWLTEENK